MTMNIREDLEKAMDDSDDDFVETQQEVVTDEPIVDEVPAVEATAEDAAKTPEDDATTTDKKEGAKAEGEAASAEPDPNAEASSDSTKDKDKSTANDSIKAPVGWKPEEREQWSKVPVPLQKRIMQREKEMSDNMANTKGARTTQEYVTKMDAQFGGLAKQAGFNNSLEAATVALNTMNTLSGGTPQQKAMEIARMVSQFGIDIETLDDALVNGAPQNPVDPQAARVAQMVAEQMAPFKQMMAERDQGLQADDQKRTEQANATVQSFAENAEFLNDVREDMADLIELSAKRGVDLTLQQAYDRACTNNPEIAKVLDKRASDAALLGDQSTLTAKLNAASSIRGNKSGLGGANKNLSLRDEIAQSFDDAAGA